MRRIVSFVWNDIRKIQKIGNRKNTSTSVMQHARGEILLEGWRCDPWLIARSMRAFAQFEPLLDEDVGERIGDGPQDDHQRRRAADIGRLEEVEIGLHLEHQQLVAGPALRHRVDDVELLDRVEQAEQRGGDDVGHQHRQRDAEEHEAPRHAVERRRFERRLGQRAQARQQQDHDEGRVDPDIDQQHGEQRRRGIGRPFEIGEADQRQQIAEDAEIRIASSAST